MHLEDHAAFTRRGRNGVMITDTDGLVIARFEHRTSRALDPQLHSHCLILNKVRDAQDGSWRALHGRPLFEEAKTAGMLYQAALRAELTRRLGVAWGPVSEHGQAELAGIPHQLLARFSTRTAEVEAAAEAKIAELERTLGRPLEADERGRVYRLAVLDTRRPKPHEHVPEVSLYERWATEARDAGWEPARSRPGGHRRRNALVRPSHAAHVVSDVVSELCVERATFTRRDVVQAVARHVDPAVGGDATLVSGHVERIADAVLADPMVVCLQAPERVEVPPAWSRRDGAQRLGGAPSRRGTRPARCSPSRAGSCTRRRSAAPLAWGSSLRRPSTVRIARRAHPARHRPARRVTRRHEPGPTRSKS